MNKTSLESEKNAKKIGENQYKDYVQKRLVKCEKSIHLTIPKNNLSLFRKKNKVSTLKVASLEDDCKLYASLYIACQSRSAEFFSHENHSYIPSISEHGKFRKSSKADFVGILESTGETREIAPEDVTMKVFDGAAIVQMTRSSTVKTYGEYSKNIFWPFVLNSKGTITRVDVVFDIYNNVSLKAETRERRGKGVRT